MSELWSAQQREWLQAMGHTVLVLAGHEAALAEQPAAAAQPLRGAAESSEASRPARSPSPVRERSEAAAPGRTASQSRGSSDEPALLRNLLRAARRASGDAEVMALFDAPGLRGNAAAKRALWPRLRALRRGSARG